MLHGIPQPPFLIAGKYEVESVLGQGGMGVVYLAKQRPLNRKVAIKMVLGAFAHEPSFLERFKSEASVAAHLSHPGIVAIHDVVEYEGTWCLVLEYVNGHTVESVIDSLGRLPEKRALHIAAQVADALDFCHRHRIVHRDIKPANIMLVEGDRARLMDFGVAKAPDSGVRTQTGMAIGTPKYMSPEQAQGLRGVDGRSDIYALGCVLFEMVTGRVPFDGPQSIAIAIAHIQEPPPRPMWIDPTLSHGIDTLILRCLEKKPEHRYQTAAELAKHLRETAAELERAEIAAANLGDQIGESRRDATPENSRGSSRAAPSVGAVAGAGLGSGAGAIGRGRGLSSAPFDLTIEDTPSPMPPPQGASPPPMPGAVSLAGLRETVAERHAATIPPETGEGRGAPSGPGYTPEERRRMSGAETNVPGAPPRPLLASAPRTPAPTHDEPPDDGTALMDSSHVAPPFAGQVIIPPAPLRPPDADADRPRHVVLWVAAICVPLILLAVGIALGPSMVAMLQRRRAAATARPTPAVTLAQVPTAAPTPVLAEKTPAATASATATPTVAPTPTASPGVSPPPRRFESPADFVAKFRSEVGGRLAQIAGTSEGDAERRAEVLKEAEAIADSAEQQFQDDPNVIGYRGVIFYYREQYDNAEDYLKIACDRLDDPSKEPRRTFEAYLRWAREKRVAAASTPSTP